jgi:hypothetical protein
VALLLRDCEFKSDQIDAVHAGQKCHALAGQKNRPLGKTKNYHALDKRIFFVMHLVGQVLTMESMNWVVHRIMHKCAKSYDGSYTICTGCLTSSFFVILTIVQKVIANQCQMFFG